MDRDQALVPHDRIVVIPNNLDLFGCSGFITDVRDDFFDIELDGPVQASSGLLPIGQVVRVQWVNVQSIERRPAGETLLRNYRGNQQADALREFQPESARLALHGFQPTSQSWAAGQWGLDAFLGSIGVLILAFFFFPILLFALVGIAIFLFLATAKPAGTLTVVFAKPLATPGLTVAADQHAARGELLPVTTPLADLLAELKAAHDSGHLTDLEYAAKRAEVISRF